MKMRKLSPCKNFHDYSIQSGDLLTFVSCCKNFMFMPPFEKGRAYCFAPVGQYVSWYVYAPLSKREGILLCTCRSVCGSVGRYPLTLCN